MKKRQTKVPIHVASEPGLDRIYVSAQRWRSLAREGETDQTEKNLIPKCAPVPNPKWSRVALCCIPV